MCAEEPYTSAKTSFACTQKSPIYLQKTHICAQKKPAYDSPICTACQQDLLHPASDQKSPIYLQRALYMRKRALYVTPTCTARQQDLLHLASDQKSPTYLQMSPICVQKSPVYGLLAYSPPRRSAAPGVGSNEPYVCSKEP